MNVQNLTKMLTHLNRILIIKLIETVCIHALTIQIVCVLNNVYFDEIENNFYFFQHQILSETPKRLKYEQLNHFHCLKYLVFNSY